MVKWSTPGSMSFSMNIIILFSECSVQVHSFTALKLYLNDKNLNYDRRIATILKFTAQNLSAYSRTRLNDPNAENVGNTTEYIC